MIIIIIIIQQHDLCFFLVYYTFNEMLNDFVCDVIKGKLGLSIDL